jgi:periplasmic divalent cation tolerance protein
LSAEYVQVLTTVGSEEEAERISSLLVDRRLAACVQVLGPITSRYRWQGEIEEEREWQCLAKTEASMYAEVEEAIRGAHSYEEPEIIAIPVIAGSRGYLEWISANVGEPS